MEARAFEIYEVIDRLQALHAAECLLGAAVVLLLIDYFFPTDIPAQFGYACLAGAAFFIAYQASWSPLTCLITFVACWVLLGILHRLIFFRFLSNAPLPPGVATTDGSPAVEGTGSSPDQN